MIKRKEIKLKRVKKEGYIEVIKTVDEVEGIATKKTIFVKEFKTDTAQVSASFGDSGNYGKGKVNVMVSLPCYVEEIETTLDAAVFLAKKKCRDEFNKLMKEIGD